jgi:photosystem II stability/assembly factor-like uncharacterized protein
MPRRIRLVAFLAAPLLAASVAVIDPVRAEAAPGGVVQCKTSGSVNGPCKLPDSVDVLLKGSAGSAGGAQDLAVASNFGLLLPGGNGKYQFICEEVFGGRIGDRSKVAPDGRIYVPALDGLYSSSDGCGWTQAKGPLMGQSVWDVAFDPMTSGRLWVVGGDQRQLGLSTDGGATVTTKYTFADGLRFIRVMVAPSDPRTIYLTGYKTKIPLVLAVSSDGGDTWAIDDNASTGVADANQVMDILGVAPDDPKTVYFVATNQNGDEVWKSTTSGHAPVKILTLPDEGQQYGFTFGARATDLYVGSRDPLETQGKPPATLFVSHDGGKTWTQSPSSEMGPRFRCLRWADGKLYACAGDQSNGDSFLLGASTDDGKSWTKVMGLSDLQGARKCVADRCVATASWLCESYGICDGFVRELPPPPADAAPPQGPMVSPGGGKKGCALGGPAAPGAGSTLLLLALIAGARRRRGGRTPR